MNYYNNNAFNSLLNKKLHDDIKQDYIDIYADGPHGDHLGRVCGNNLPEAIPPQVKIYREQCIDNSVFFSFFSFFYSIITLSHKQYSKNLKKTLEKK